MAWFDTRIELMTGVWRNRADFFEEWRPSHALGEGFMPLSSAPRAGNILVGAPDVA
jgi:hypothetical protein